MKTIVENILVIVIQLLILNHLNITDLLVPQIVFIVILSLPVSWSMSYQFLAAFVLGLLLDFFTATPGMQASALLFVPVVRNLLFKLYDLEELFLNKSRFHLSNVKILIYLAITGIVGFVYHLYLFSLVHLFQWINLSFWLALFISFSTAFGFVLIIQFIFSSNE